MRSRGAVEVSAVLGPCIHVECYEFGPLELAGLLERYGPSVAGRSRQGLPALDLVAGVARALQEVDVAVDTTPSRCTSCHGDLYSWRARADRGRLAGIIWREP